MTVRGIKGLTNEDIKGLSNFIEKTTDFKDMYVSYTDGAVRLVRRALTINDYVIYDSDYLWTLHKAITVARKEGRVIEFRSSLGDHLKNKATDAIHLAATTSRRKQLEDLTNLVFQFIRKFDYVGSTHRLQIEINEKDYHKLTYGHKDRLNELYTLKLERAFAYRVRFRNNVTEGDVQLLQEREPFVYLKNYVTGKNKKVLTGINETNYKEHLKAILHELDVDRFQKELAVATTQLEMLDKKLTERDNILDSYLHLNDRSQEEYDREQSEKFKYARENK